MVPDHYEKDFDLLGYDRNYNPGLLFHLFEKTI